MLVEKKIWLKYIIWIVHIVKQCRLSYDGGSRSRVQLVKGY